MLTRPRTLPSDDEQRAMVAARAGDPAQAAVGLGHGVPGSSDGVTSQGGHHACRVFLCFLRDAFRMLLFLALSEGSSFLGLEGGDFPRPL